MVKTPTRSSSSRSAILKLGALVLLLVATFFVARALGFFELRDPRVLARAIRGLRERRFAAPIFVVVYAVASAVALPGSILSIAGGAIFGFGAGTLVDWLGASMGATLAYLIARSLGMDAVRRLLGRRADTLAHLVGAHGFLTILRLRLIPVVPFNLLNYAAGLAGVGFRDYVLGTVLGTLPVCAAYAYFADTLMSGAEGAEGHVFVRVLIVCGLLVSLSFLPALARRLGWIEDNKK